MCQMAHLGAVGWLSPRGAACGLAGGGSGVQGWGPRWGALARSGPPSGRACPRREETTSLVTPAPVCLILAAALRSGAGVRGSAPAAGGPGPGGPDSLVTAGGLSDPLVIVGG